MFDVMIKKLFGSRSQRYLKTLQPLVAAMNERESALRGLDAAALRGLSNDLRRRSQNGEDSENLVIDGFALVREAAQRTLGQRHYDVQLLGGLVLHHGHIAEMKTGEGKTLVATLPVYVNALSGKGVHVVTVNDYLAQRDAEWMGAVYRFLGLSVGCLKNGMQKQERQQAYGCDVLYATNNELGFDYLRDNMVHDLASVVQKPFHYGLVDEVDSILIDEARTPLIISGASADSSELYRSIDPFVARLQKGDYDKDEKMRSVSLSEKGTEKMEQMLQQAELLEGGLYDVGNVSVVHHVQQALRARYLFQRDVDYLIREGRVVIIDEFTGRMMEGRRFSDGLHQALEAKEGVAVQLENQTLASITFQNYFRLYPRLAGMTGTAMTEREELGSIYHLDVIEVPTHQPFVRQDHDDEIYRRRRDKLEAIVALIKECHQRQQPVLVGTISIEKSEELSALLKQEKIRHHVLNARYHEQEAHIIARAGCSAAVTIATNMAGRGTDIQLGGNAEMMLGEALADITDETRRQHVEKDVKDKIATDKAKAVAAGGLYVIGTERHESRRIDNQLRGRSGRQGDPGASKFFLSLEDDLMRIFGGEKLDRMMERFGIDEKEAVQHAWVNKAIAKAQERVENNHFEVRKHLLRYDDVMNDQRNVIYRQRRSIMESDSQHVDATDDKKTLLESLVLDMGYDVLSALVERGLARQDGFDDEAEKMKTLEASVAMLLGVDARLADGDVGRQEDIEEAMHKMFARVIDEKQTLYGFDLWHAAEKSLVLQLLDHHWKDHLLHLDHLRQGINLRAYAQKDPLNEYKREAFDLFHRMLDGLRERVTFASCHLRIESRDSVVAGRQNKRKHDTMIAHRGDFGRTPADQTLSTSKTAGDRGGDSVRHLSRHQRRRVAAKQGRKLRRRLGGGRV